MKKCKSCGVEKEFTHYYKHKQMANGYLNICKDCTKSRVSNHRKKNIDTIRAKDRERGNRQPPGYLKEYREKYPRKYKAHIMIQSAIRAGKLFRENCSICDNIEAHAHHDDYAKPLNVRWLCPACHSQWHAKNGEAKNP